ncbi:hypothetical protein BDZ97DRAFT_1791674 [Flammula alnicola]|nr:hypothetical protein BDZ97DRAFT_1791674 [Flammula alnicola]
MLFRPAFALLSTFMLVQSAAAALTPDQVVTNIGIVTTISGNLNTAVGSLSTTPTPQQAQTTANTLTGGFSNIINDLSGDVTAMDATPAYDDADATVVVAALTAFIQVHQDLLSTVIGKHSVFAQFGATAPIAAALRSLEAIVDSFAISMINLIPTKADDVQTGAASLNTSVGNSITLYQQICVPSPLYPTIPPVCIAP